MSEEQAENGKRARRVMAIMSHPDDIEFSCGATVAKWASEGEEITFVLGTSGDKGSDDPSFSSETLMETREAEQRAAAEILGVKNVDFLRMRDAELVADLETRKNVTRVIRKYKPDAIICQDPTMRYAGGYINHPDHIAMGEAVLAAVYPSARDRLTFPELLAEGYEPHKVREVYLSAGPGNVDHFVDVTSFMEKKYEALKAHHSQLGEWDFRPMMEQWGRDSAALARHQNAPGAHEMTFAEGFKYIHIGH